MSCPAMMRHIRLEPAAVLGAGPRGGLVAAMVEIRVAISAQQASEVKHRCDHNISGQRHQTLHPPKNNLGQPEAERFLTWWQGCGTSMTRCHRVGRQKKASALTSYNNLHSSYQYKEKTHKNCNKIPDFPSSSFYTHSRANTHCVK